MIVINLLLLYICTFSSVCDFNDSQSDTFLIYLTYWRDDLYVIYTNEVSTARCEINIRWAISGLFDELR